MALKSTSKVSSEYGEAIRFLYGLQKFGMKFGLEGIRRLLRQLGNPHRKFRSVHVAGTNGKGSTAAMIASVLTAAGYKTGLYTSPHLIDFRERIRIDGKPIPRLDVVRLVRKIRPEVVRRNATFFEAVTAAAFAYFAEKKVDIAIVETGLGGRLDATNVLTPLVSVITTIGLEHTQILGRKLSDIAREKAGIVKRGVVCVTGVEKSEPLKVIRNVCARKGTRLRRIDEIESRLRESNFAGVIADVHSKETDLPALRISLSGSHQLRNARLALLALQELRRAYPRTASPSVLRNGFRRLRRLTGLEGRLAVERRRPLLVLDVAHNSEATESMVKAMREAGVSKCRVVFGVMKDKAYRRMCRTLSPIAAEAVAVAAQTSRSRASSDIRRCFVELGVRARTAHSVRHGVQIALSASRTKLPILITGSHFVVGEAAAYLRRKNYLTINQ